MRLVPLSDAHLHSLARLAVDPDVRRFTRFPDPPETDFPVRLLERFARGRADGTSAAFAAVDPELTFLGLAVAPQIDRAGRELELGYLVAPGARGRGIATRILRELTRWAFADVGALRAELVIDVENAASRRVAERCGYALEGVRRSVHVKGDRRADAAIYARLAAQNFRETFGQVASGSPMPEPSEVLKQLP